MTKAFVQRVENLQKKLQNQFPNEAQRNKRKKWNLSMVMVNMMLDQLYKYDNIYFQYQTLENFANFHKDPNIKQCWTETEWQQWHTELVILTQQLPPMENIALAA